MQYKYCGNGNFGTQINKAIFWDFDGTLIYSNESFLDSLTEAFRKYDYVFERNILKEFLISVCSWYAPEREYTETTGELWWKALLDGLQLFCNRQGVKESDSHLICKQFRENVINFKYRLYNDTEAILAYCKDKGYDNYILSNNFPELVGVIKGFGLDKYITDCFLSSNIGYEKPRIEIFQYAVKQAKEPEVCYMIGDNPVADMKGGKEAGLQTILVHNTKGNEFADYICESLTDIKKIL